MNFIEITPCDYDNKIMINFKHVTQVSDLTEFRLLTFTDGSNLHVCDAYYTLKQLLMGHQ
jgi:hypothetical protein